MPDAKDGIKVLHLPGHLFSASHNDVWAKLLQRVYPVLLGGVRQPPVSVLQRGVYRVA